MSDCYCDFDSPEFYIETWPKAAKEHVCSECCGIIKPGETYKNARGKWDGDVATFKICPDCYEFEKWALAILPCLCIPLGGALEHILEEMRECEADCPGLTQETRDKINAIKAKRKKEVHA